jgi:hypothetical protein
VNAIEAVADELETSTESLNATFVEVVHFLAELHLGVAAEVDLDDGAKLVFCKAGGKWGLHVRLPGGDTPLLSASRKLRVAAAHKLEDLHAALLVAVQHDLDDVRTASQIATAALEKLRKEHT